MIFTIIIQKTINTGIPTKMYKVNFIAYPLPKLAFLPQ